MKDEQINFWFLGHRIHLRVSDELKKKVLKICFTEGFSLTELMGFLIRNFLDNYADRSDKGTNKFLLMVKKRKDLKYLRKAHKEKNFCRYLIKNTQRKIYEQQRSYFFNSGKMDMKIVNKVINESKKEFEAFPSEIRKELKEQMGFLESFRNEDFLIGRMGIFRQVEMEKRKQK